MIYNWNVKVPLWTQFYIIISILFKEEEINKIYKHIKKKYIYKHIKKYIYIYKHIKIYIYINIFKKKGKHQLTINYYRKKQGRYSKGKIDIHFTTMFQRKHFIFWCIQIIWTHGRGKYKRRFFINKNFK